MFVPLETPGGCENGCVVQSLFEKYKPISSQIQPYRRPLKSYYIKVDVRCRIFIGSYSYLGYHEIGGAPDYINP